MGCVSSNLLNQSDDFSQLTGCSHHFVKLTSSTYGLLNLDPLPPPPISASPMTPPERFTIVSKELKSEPEVINFWELVSGLDADDACNRLTTTPVKCDLDSNWEKSRDLLKIDEVFQPLDPKFTDGGDNRVVIYTTSLRGVRRTFEECNAVKAAIESFGVVICERDVSMDKGFREELSDLMAEVKNGDLKSTTVVLPPRVFVKGKYIGGAEEVMRLVEEGKLKDLLLGIPRKKDLDGGGNCDSCGGLSFLPCSDCNGSCKVVEGWGRDAVIVKCTECNENGLVRCPVCS